MWEPVAQATCLRSSLTPCMTMMVRPRVHPLILRSRLGMPRCLMSHLLPVQLWLNSHERQFAHSSSWALLLAPVRDRQHDMHVEIRSKQQRCSSSALRLLSLGGTGRCWSGP